MIRLALDSDQLPALQLVKVQFVLTYSDMVPDLPALEAEHPGATVLLIDRGLGDPGLRATLADVETGALTPADLPRWMDEREGRPYLTVYSNRDNTPAVIQALGARAAWHWVATLDGTAFIEGWPPMHGPALVQILGAGKLGIHADLSLVLNDGWHPAPRVPVSANVAADVAQLLATASHLDTTLARLRTDLQA